MSLTPNIIGDVETISNEVAHSLTLYCWSHYGFSPEGDVPSLEYIRGVRNIYTYNDKEEGHEKVWLNTLLKYGYRKRMILMRFLLIWLDMAILIRAVSKDK